MLSVNDEIDFDEKDPDLDKNELSVETILNNNKSLITVLLIGIILTGIGVYSFKQGNFGASDKIEILSDVSLTPTQGRVIVVEVSGAVEKPGVYKLNEGSRIEDLLIASGGISADADRGWVEKFINRAAKLIDGQKLYILRVGEQSVSMSANKYDGIKQDQGILGTEVSGTVDINTANLQQLDTLPGIGQVYGKSIIEHRPYSEVSELLSKGVLKQGVYDKIKDLVTVY